MGSTFRRTRTCEVGEEPSAEGAGAGGAAEEPSEPVGSGMMSEFVDMVASKSQECVRYDLSSEALPG